jgi:hypothetical protein
MKPDDFFDKSKCAHKNLTFDENGQSIICDDCNKSLSAYWVLRRIITDYNKAWEGIERKRSELNDLMEKTLHFKAAKKVEEVWRSKTMLPSCPHCKRGICSHDQFGYSTVSKEFELKMRDGKK